MMFRRWGRRRRGGGAAAIPVPRFICGKCLLIVMIKIIIIIMVCLGTGAGHTFRCGRHVRRVESHLTLFCKCTSIIKMDLDDIYLSLDVLRLAFGFRVFGCLFVGPMRSCAPNTQNRLDSRHRTGIWNEGPIHASRATRAVAGNESWRVTIASVCATDFSHASIGFSRGLASK